jgi:hypothetical protein
VTISKKKELKKKRKKITIRYSRKDHPPYFWLHRCGRSTSFHRQVYLFPRSFKGNRPKKWSDVCCNFKKNGCQSLH